MDARAVVRGYVEEMISEPPGLKALILDDETIRIVSLVYSQSELLNKEVILIDKLKRLRDGKKSKASNATSNHLTCIVFIRPSAENIHVLSSELRQTTSQFKSYRLFFSNILKRTLVEEIAYADTLERVGHIGEMYADFYALSSNLISFGVLPCIPGIIKPSSSSSTGRSYLQNPNIERTVDSIISIILALKLNEPNIRFQSSSSLCRNIGERLAVKFDQERALFDFNNPNRNKNVVGSTMILIVDRREDPVTPLLNQWTYEAMLHEIIGIKYNRISLPSESERDDDATANNMVLDDDEDRFYHENRYINFGQLGSNLQTMVKQYQQDQTAKQNDKNIDIEDMLKLISNYPELQRQSIRVNKHVTLTSLLSKRVASLQLLEVSQLEQDIACRESQADHRKEVIQILKGKQYATVSISDKLRLIILYALRYEERADTSSTISLMCQQLQHGQKQEEYHKVMYLVNAIKHYAGVKRRSGSSDLFNNRSFFAVASNSVRRGIGGVENVYTQHEPLLVHTLDGLFRGRLKDNEYPLVRPDDVISSTNINNSTNLITSDSILSSSSSSTSAAASSSSSLITPCKNIVVVMAGGTTYEESKCISAINNEKHAFVPSEGSMTASAAQAAQQLSARVVLAGTWVHNSTSFAVEISENAKIVTEEEEERGRGDRKEKHFIKKSL